MRGHRGISLARGNRPVCYDRARLGHACVALVLRWLWLQVRRSGVVK